MDYRIPISVVCKERSVKTRSAISWCVNNHIPCYGKGENTYIYKVDYDLVLDKQLIEDLKKRYTKNWEKAYELYKSNNVAGMFKEDFANVKTIKKRYSPESPISKNLANK